MSRRFFLQCTNPFWTAPIHPWFFRQATPMIILPGQTTPTNFNDFGDKLARVTLQVVLFITANFIFRFDFFRTQHVRIIPFCTHILKLSQITHTYYASYSSINRSKSFEHRQAWPYRKMSSCTLLLVMYFVRSTCCALWVLIILKSSTQ